MPNLDRATSRSQAAPKTSEPSQPSTQDLLAPLDALPVDKSAGDDVWSGSLDRWSEMQALVAATGPSTWFGQTAQFVHRSPFVVNGAINIAVIRMLAGAGRGGRAEAFLHAAALCGARPMSPRTG